MDRRQFVASVGLTLAAGSSPAHASGNAWVSLLTALQDGYDQGTKAFDWLFWSQDAVIAMQQGKAPPPSPHSPAIFQERLDKERARVSAMTIPSYESTLPSTGAVPTNGFDVTRAAIRDRIRLLQDCIAELADSRSAIKYLQQTERALTMQETMLWSLANALWDLAEKIPLPILIETLAFQAVDVESSYVPTVSKTKDILVAKRRTAETGIGARLAALRTAANEIRNVLLLEAIDLRTEAQRLERLDNDVRLLEEGLRTANQARESAVALVQRRSHLLDAAILDRDETEARLDDARRELSSIESQIATAQSAAEKPYICPINFVGWDTCTNEAHIIYKVSYTDNRTRLLNEVAGLQKRRSTQRTLIGDIASDFRWQKEQVQVFERDLDAAQDELTKAEARLKSAQHAFAEKAKFVLEEKWRSKADLFSKENASDQEEIGAAINRLSDST